jgi:hypothetical protein
MATRTGRPSSTNPKAPKAVPAKALFDRLVMIDGRCQLINFMLHSVNWELLSRNRRDPPRRTLGLLSFPGVVLTQDQLFELTDEFHALADSAREERDLAFSQPVCWTEPTVNPVRSGTKPGAAGAKKPPRTAVRRQEAELVTPIRKSGPKVVEPVANEG